MNVFLKLLFEFDNSLTTEEQRLCPSLLIDDLVLQLKLPAFLNGTEI